MTNAEQFKKTFGIYAEEFWSYTEKQMLDWINTDVPDTNVGDMISRQAAIDAIHCDITVTGRQNAELVAATIGAFADRIKALPSAQPEPHYDEWCDDCKEYDKERHCCPRWNRVIRQTLKDAQPELRRGEES